MTKEQLDELERDLDDWSRSDQAKLIRLARLGLWASTHMATIHNTLYSSMSVESASALAALPEKK